MHWEIMDQIISTIIYIREIIPGWMNCRQLLNAKLPHLEKMNQERRRIADRYLSEIHNETIILPYVPENANPVWHIFGIRCETRDQLKSILMKNGIGTNKHYPIPIHFTGML